MSESGAGANPEDHPVGVPQAVIGASQGLGTMVLALRALFVLLVVLVLEGLALASTEGGAARAQNPPATYYGTASPGVVIEAFVSQQSCGSTTANERGEWVLSIADSSATCSPAAGSLVMFTVNGEAVEQTATWVAGGASELAFGLAETGVGRPPTTSGSTSTESEGSDVDLLLVAVIGVVAIFAGAFVGLVIRWR